MLLKRIGIGLLALSIWACSSEKPAEEFSCELQNKVIINSLFCGEFGLPLAEYSIEYPNHFGNIPPKKGEANTYYNFLVDADENGIHKESISFGINTLDYNGVRYIEFAYLQLAEIQNSWEALKVDLSDEWIGESDYQKHPYFIYRAKAHFERPDMNLVGDYQLISILAHPPFGGKNGVFVSMILPYDENKAEWTDYLDNTCSGAIFNSLTWRTN
ncbi:MAG: hypothetical protein SchgKO_25200 [Schleiferiaceae bacterium]